MIDRQYISGHSYILKESSTPKIRLDNSLEQFSNFFFPVRKVSESKLTSGLSYVYPLYLNLDRALLF